MAGEVFIDRPPDQVRAFFVDINSLVLWDRSVSKVLSNSFDPLGGIAGYPDVLFWKYLPTRLV